jgi:hypothetical protein
MKGIQVIKDQVLFKGGIITKMWWGHLKMLFLRTMKPEKAEFYMKAFWHRISDKGNLIKIMDPRGSNGGNEMHIIILYGPRLLRWAMWPMGLLLISFPLISKEFYHIPVVGEAFWIAKFRPSLGRYDICILGSPVLTRVWFFPISSNMIGSSKK